MQGCVTRDSVRLPEVGVVPSTDGPGVSALTVYRFVKADLPIVHAATVTETDDIARKK